MFILLVFNDIKSKITNTDFTIYLYITQSPFSLQVKTYLIRIIKIASSMHFIACTDILNVFALTRTELQEMNSTVFNSLFAICTFYHTL